MPLVSNCRKASCTIDGQIEAEVFGRAPLESGVPCVTIGKNDSHHYLGKEDEDKEVFINYSQNQSVNLPSPTVDQGVVPYGNRDPSISVEINS